MSNCDCIKHKHELTDGEGLIGGASLGLLGAIVIGGPIAFGSVATWTFGGAIVGFMVAQIPSKKQCTCSKCLCSTCLCSKSDTTNLTVAIDKKTNNLKIDI